MKLLPAILAATVMLSAGMVARAGDPTAPSPPDASAEVLFQDALDLMKRGRFIDACPKLESSQELDPRSGTLISLGFCYESLGRVATAAEQYRAAADLAATEGRKDYQEKAAGLIAKIQERVPHLSFTPLGGEPGLIVELDGKPIEPALLDTPIPVDPGGHAVRASAPGYTSWSATTTAELGKSISIEVPALTPKQSSTSQPTVILPPPDRGEGSGVSGSEVLGFTLIGVGTAATAVGFVLGALVLDRSATVEQECDEQRRLCSAAGLEASDSGETLSLGSTILVAGGLLSASAGVFTLVLSGDGDDSPGATIGARPLASGAGVTLEGTF